MFWALYLIQPSYAKPTAFVWFCLVIICHNGARKEGWLRYLPQVACNHVSPTFTTCRHRACIISMHDPFEFGSLCFIVVNWVRLGSPRDPGSVYHNTRSNGRWSGGDEESCKAWFVLRRMTELLRIENSRHTSSLRGTLWRAVSLELWYFQRATPSYDE